MYAVVIAYFAVGLVISAYLWMTSKDYSENREFVKGAGWLFLFAPETIIPIVFFWPLYVVIRIINVTIK